jgi:hypothetical protein
MACRECLDFAPEDLFSKLGPQVGKIFRAWGKNLIDNPVPVLILSKLHIRSKLKIILNLRTLAKRVLSANA